MRMTKKILLQCFLTFFLLSTTGAIKESCKNQEDLISRCNMALPVLSSPDSTFALTREELEKSCVELRAGIRCIDNYTEMCMQKQEQVLFRRIYAGITNVVQELCTQGSYQDEYLKHAECVKTVRTEYEKCSKQYEVTLTRLSNSQSNSQYATDADVNHEDHLKTVCCSFQDYLTCSERTVQSACGEEAAQFTNNFLKRMASNIIKSYCLEYRGQECRHAGKSTHIENSLILLGSGLFIHILIKHLAGRL